MDVRQQDVERIVVEVLKKMMSDQPTAAATTVVAASGCDCGDFGLFDRLEDAVQAAEAAQKKISTVAMRDKIIAAIRKAGCLSAQNNLIPLGHGPIKETWHTSYPHTSKEKFLCRLPPVTPPFP